MLSILGLKFAFLVKNTVAAVMLEVGMVFGLVAGCQEHFDFRVASQVS